MAGPARGHVRGFLSSLLPPTSGWAETHMAGGSWHHHTGTWWGWAKAWLVTAAGREEAPKKEQWGLCLQGSHHRAGPHVLSFHKHSWST